MVTRAMGGNRDHGYRGHGYKGLGYRGHGYGGHGTGLLISVSSFQIFTK